MAHERKRFVRALTAGLMAGAALLFGAAAAFAAEPDVVAGRAFAEKNCSRCHAIGKTGASPFKPAPPFRTFAAKWPLEDIEESLAEGIVVGHPAMPEFTLSPDEIDNLIAYLKTIQAH
jgi:cytochrome c